jgi:hypothetical protein
MMTQHESLPTTSGDSCRSIIGYKIQVTNVVSRGIKTLSTTQEERTPNTRDELVFEETLNA